MKKLRMPKFKFPKIKSKSEKLDEELLRQYEQGLVLQVDNKVDNKAYLKSKQII